MQPTDLARECLRVLNTQHGAEFIVLVGRLPQKGWPRGKALGSDSRGRYYSYPAAKVLARLLIHGVCSVAGSTLEPGTIDIRVSGDPTPHPLEGEATRLFCNAMHGAWFRSKQAAAPIQPESIEAK